MTEKYVKELKAIDVVMPITKNWEELSIEELEERVELKSCGTHCNKNNHEKG